jgi:hypothetical protein
MDKGVTGADRLILAVSIYLALLAFNFYLHVPQISRIDLTNDGHFEQKGVYLMIQRDNEFNLNDWTCCLEFLVMRQISKQ